MGRIFLGLLAVGWGAVLIPAGLRRRSERGSFSLLGIGASVAALLTIARRSPSRVGTEVLWSPDSARGYSGGPVPPLGGLYGASRRSSGGVPAGLPGSRVNMAAPRISRSVRRQRQIVLASAGLAVICLLLSFVPGLMFLLIGFALASVALATYMVLLIRVKHQRITTRPESYDDRLPWAS